MKLFGDIRKEYGQNTVKSVRSLENLERRISRHRNSVIFSLRCRDEGIIPPSLRIKCPIKSKRAQDIVDKARKELLRERIRVTNNNLKDLEED